MAQAKRKTATRTKKSAAKRTTKKQAQSSNMFFVISMSVLAATLLFADLIMLAA